MKKITRPSRTKSRSVNVPACSRRVKVLATTAALTAPILLPTVAQAKATWT